MTYKFNEAPMMSDFEVNLIEGILRANNIKRVLEYGSGGSTNYFPKAVESIEKWVSIEHDRDYEEYLGPKVSPKVTIHIETNMEEYIKAESPIGFDLIFIDGMIRDKCLDYVMSILPFSSGTQPIVLLHDAGRKEYEAWMNKYRHIMLCNGEIPSAGGGFAHRGIALFV